MKRTNKIEKVNLFYIYESKVRDILKSKSIKIDFTDDDILWDFLGGLYEKGFSGFSFKETQIILFYNTMLQMKASNPIEIEYWLEREIIPTTII